MHYYIRQYYSYHSSSFTPDFIFGRDEMSMSLSNVCNTVTKLKTMHCFMCKVSLNYLFELMNLEDPKFHVRVGI